jgi:predicted nucleotidyltransferase
MKTALETEDRGDGQLTRLLNTLTEELQRQLGSDLWLLLLYGSHARGEAQPDSDVDLFVVLRRASEATQEKVRQVAYNVMWEADFAYVISLYLTDVHHYETLEQRGSSFLRNVQREGQVLRSRSSRSPSHALTTPCSMQPKPSCSWMALM